MLTSCSIGYYDSGVLLATTANISVQPAWGPAGYDCAHYYYFPDYNFYYDVNNALFYYLSGSRWLSARQLPYSLGYPRDLYKLYKVVLNIRDPWNYNRRHISEYKHFKGMHNQPVLRDKYPDRYPQSNYRPQSGNRPPQVNTQPKPQVKPQARPQSSGNRYNGQSSPSTIRNSRNNNTSRNNVATQPSGTGRDNSKLQQSQQRPNTQGQGSRSNVGTQKRTNSSAANTSRSKNSTTTNKKSENKSSSSTKRTNSSSGSRSTGSRGR